MTHRSSHRPRRTFGQRPWAAGLLALLLVARAGHAGDLNAEVNAMFNNLGAMGNYSTPGAFRGQAYNTFAGGSLYLRSPNKVYQLTTVAFPTAKAGCGGIDVFGGSFSHISATEFKNILANITSALPGVAFQAALDTVSPLLGGITKWSKGIETWINNARINSCETAKSLVSTAAEATGFDQQEACAKLAVQMGLEPDSDAARRRCGTDRAGVLATARNSKDAGIRAQAPFVGNLTWAALKNVSTVTDQEREFIMSMVGTAIFYPEESGQEPTIVAPTLTSISQLLYGQSDAGGGNVNVHLLACNNYTACDVVTDNPNYVHTPFTVQVQRMMETISQKIATRTVILDGSAEVGFVNMTSEPVYKMLSIGNIIPGSGLATVLISKYRDVIATDYAHTFLERNLRAGMTALTRDYNLNARTRDKIAVIQQSGLHLLSRLASEKAILYAKVGSFNAISSDLETIQRQMRASLPHNILAALGASVYRR